MRSVTGFFCALLALAMATGHAQEAPPQTQANNSADRQQSDGAHPLTRDDVNNWLDGYVPVSLEMGDIAGALVVVVKDGEILTQRGYGYADVAEKKPVDASETLFRLGSIGKLFTWTAVMQLVEQGKIDLDADINTYLDFEIPDRKGEPITMRNLMQHVPGFEEQLRNLMTRNGDDMMDYEDLLKRWTPKRIFAPGTTPAYSNYGAGLAGYVVQRVSGMDYEDYLQRYIFQPLDMDHTTSRQPLPPELQPYMSKGYSLASQKANGFEFLTQAPAGSHASTAGDMANFMIAHLQRGEFRGRRIMKADTAEEMHSSELTIIPGLNRMKLGFFETDINGRNVSNHAGDTVDFHTALYMFMDDNVGFFVAFNSAGRSSITAFLRQTMYEDFADRYLPGPSNTDGRVDPETAAQHAALMAGKWQSSRRSQSTFMHATGLMGQTTVSVGPNGELIASPPGLNLKPRRWVEIEPFVWRDTQSHQKLVAKVVDGKPVRYGVDMYAPVVMFDRVPWHKNESWLVPLLMASLGALALTAVLWPVAALIRRRYGVERTLEPAALLSHRLTRIAAVAILAALYLWVFTISRMFADFSNLSAASDPFLLSAQIFSAIAFIGGVAVTAGNAWLVWRSEDRSWFAKLWSTVLVLSALTVLYVGFAFHLVRFSLYY